MSAKPLPPLELLNSLLRLDANSPSGLEWASSGKPAGAVSRQPYSKVPILGNDYRCHRLVWSIANGELISPLLHVDHINGDPCDNRPENLRACTQSENLQNTIRKKRKDLQGATLDRDRNRWKAEIYNNGERIHIGWFKTSEEARAAYLSAKKLLHPFWVEERINKPKVK